MFKSVLGMALLFLAQAAPLIESKAESGCCAVQEDFADPAAWLGCRLKGAEQGVDNSRATEMTFLCENMKHKRNEVVGEVTVKCLRGSCPGIDPYVHINTHWISPLMVFAACGMKVLHLKNIWAPRTSMFCPVGDYNAFGWPIEECEEGTPFWIRRSTEVGGTC